MRRGRLTPHLVAVVDLGSTAVRLLSRPRSPPASGYRVLAAGARAHAAGRWRARHAAPRARSTTTLRAVHRFFARYSPNGRGPRIVAVATSAVRDARNRERLLGTPAARGRHRRAGPERAGRGAARRRRPPSRASPFKNGVVADLGGASLQLSRVRRRRVVSIASLSAGRRPDHTPFPAPRSAHAARAARRSGPAIRAASSGSTAPRPAWRDPGRSRRHRPHAGRHPPAAPTAATQAPPRAAAAPVGCHCHSRAAGRPLPTRAPEDPRSQG